MDPISALIAVWLVAVFLTTRLPKLLTESSDGETREAYLERLKRLEQAGIEPASKGGPLRRFLGDAWRDFLLDRYNKRKAASGGPDDSGRSWWSRQVDRAFDAWRDRHRRAEAGSSDADRDADRDADDDPDPGSDDGQDHDGMPSSDGDRSDPDAQWETETVEDTAHWGPFDPPDNDTGEGETSPDAPGDEEPIRVESTTGDPIPDNPQPPPDQSPDPSSQPALPQGDPEMTAVLPAGGEVTGVVSGAQEARAIQVQVNQITAAYVAALRRIGVRISQLGDAAMANVQLAHNSHVVAAIVQAAESTAAAMGYARGATTEVESSLQVVKNAFNRLNS